VPRVAGLKPRHDRKPDTVPAVSAPALVQEVLLNLASYQVVVLDEGIVEASQLLELDHSHTSKAHRAALSLRAVRLDYAESPPAPIHPDLTHVQLSC